MFLFFLGRPFQLAFGVIYPGYRTFLALHPNSKASSSPHSDGDLAALQSQHAAIQPWIIYWLMYSSFMTVSWFSDFFFFWLPFYSEFKLIFIAYMVMHDARGASCLYHHFFLPFVAQQESVCNTLYACHLTLFSSDYFTGESIRRSALAVIRTSSVWLCTSFSAALVFCHANLAAASQTENSPHVSPVATNGTHWSIQLANFVSFAGTFINRKLDENDPHIQTFIQYGGVRQFLPVLSDSSVEKEKEMETFKNATIFQRAQVSLDKGLRSTSSSFEDLE